METTPAQHLVAAREALERGDARAALGATRSAFRVLRGEHDDLVPALRVLSPVVRALGEDDLADVAARAADVPADPRAIYKLGFDLVERRAFDVAACMLARANVLHPGEVGIVSELVAALEGDGRHAQAVAVLRAVPSLVEQQFVCRYLLAFDTLMSGDIEAARPLARAMRPGDDDEARMAGRISSMMARVDLARAAGATLGRQDLRGWHFVTTGGILLHLSPWGFRDGMNGRYAFTQDSWSRCRMGVERLRAVLSAWDAKPRRVLAPGDRDSRAIGGAAADMLGVPVEDYAADRAGLVVVYDLAALDAHAPTELLHHASGQRLFAHATCWTLPPVCAADVTTFFHQVNQAPWGEQLRRNDAGGMEKGPADASGTDVLSSRIVSALPWAEDTVAGDDVDALVAFARAVKRGASAFCTAGRRSPSWEGGPVPSSRFT